MKLNKNSWYVGLNDYVYGSGYSENNHNLCPFFWGTILAIIICIPTAITRFIDDIIPDDTKGMILIVTLIVVAIIGVGYGLIMDWQATLLVIGAVVAYAAFILGMVFGIGHIFEWYSGRHTPKPKKQKPRKEPRPHMTIEMFKGWKNKHCPLISWDEDED